MSYLTNDIAITMANDGSFIICIDCDCLEEDDWDDEEEYSMSSDNDIILTAKNVEEVSQIINKYLPKLKIKSAEDIFNKV